MKKIVQIAAVGGPHGAVVIALCEDGLLWELSPATDPDGAGITWLWDQLPPIPDREGGA